ncbi:MAG TPA: hypothetical protein VFQ98_05435 [Gallionella sp.]|nr:hypothetical protein [Gallionella sp.]
MSLLIMPQPPQHLPAALSFPPYFLSIYSIHAKQSAAIVRWVHLNLPQFQPHQAVVKAGLARIRAGVGQLISGAELMRRLVYGERRAVKNHHPASVGMMFRIFTCWRREAPIPLYV